MKKILFVCKGNIYRSQLAAHLAREKFSDIQVDSAGLCGTSMYGATKHSHISKYECEFEKAQAALSQCRITLWQSKNKPLTSQLANKADLIIVFDQKLKSDVIKLFPKSANKIFLLNELAGETEEILDPMRQSLEQYFKSTEQIVTYLEKLKQTRKI